MDIELQLLSLLDGMPHPITHIYFPYSNNHASGPPFKYNELTFCLTYYFSNEDKSIEINVLTKTLCGSETEGWKSTGIQYTKNYCDFCFEIEESHPFAITMKSYLDKIGIKTNTIVQKYTNKIFK